MSSISKGLERQKEVKREKDKEIEEMVWTICLFHAQNPHKGVLLYQ